MRLLRNLQLLLLATATAAGLSARAQTGEPPAAGPDPAWIDLEWLAHLTWRANQMEKEGNGSGLEAVCREALRLAPAYDGAVERLAKLYERNQEEELALMARLYRASFNTNLGSEAVNPLVTQAEEFRAKARPPATEEELLKRNEELDQLAGAIAEDLRNGRLGACEARLREALRKRPSDPKLLLDLGGIYIRGREWGMALMLFSYAHRLHPANSDFANNLASALARMDRPAQALEVLEKQLKGDPASVYMLENAGMLASRLGQSRRALMHFSKWIEVDPTNASAWTRYGAALVEAGPEKLVFAKVAFRKVLDMSPSNPMALYYLAAIEAMRDNERACADHLRELRAVLGREKVAGMLAEAPFQRLPNLSGLMDRTGRAAGGIP